MSKEDIDRQCEREGQALRRQGRNFNHNDSRTRQQMNYNKKRFDRLFRR